MELAEGQRISNLAQSHQIGPCSHARLPCDSTWLVSADYAFNLACLSNSMKTELNGREDDPSYLPCCYASSLLKRFTVVLD